MEYRNLITGAVIQTDSTISGEDWEEVSSEKSAKDEKAGKGKKAGDKR